MNDDLISRQAAIEALGEEPEVWSENDEYALGLKTQWIYDVDALKDLPSAQRWIPVTERLPKAHELIGNMLRHYLVQTEYGDMMVCSWSGTKWEQIFQYEPTDDEIIAWMPLPEPYRKETEDAEQLPNNH